MPLRINNIRLGLDDGITELKMSAAKALGVGVQDIQKLSIIKEAIDARRKNKLDIVYSLAVELREGSVSFQKSSLPKDISFIEPIRELPVIKGDIKLNNRPVVVGTGPSGLFAAYMLAQNGYRPIVIERGEACDERADTVARFWKGEGLNTESNVQFGEGGAGTFSDGKLTTRINDPLCDKVLQVLAKHGAPEEILYRAKPHIGTDLLREVVKNLRKSIIKMGAEVHFSTKLTDIDIKSGVLKGIYINGSDYIACQCLVLAVGHSARDTFVMLNKAGVFLEPKAFAVGVRIEHPQKLIDTAQYGSFAGHPRLKPAEYSLVYKENDRACFSFCMCPGGMVVAAASEQGCVVTNGMSEYKRDAVNANSAIVVSVTPKDFGSNNIFCGMELQRQMETLAYNAAGGGYLAPIQQLGDFLNNRPSVSLGKAVPSYPIGVKPTELNKCLPDYTIGIMQNGLRYFGKKLNGFDSPNAILTGVETRTSSPVRITRAENGQALNITGLYPSGEGAGYAGGIVSAAVDGLRTAYKIMGFYAPD